MIFFKINQHSIIVFFTLMSRVLITGRDVSKTQNWEAAANQQELFTKKQKDLLEKAAPGSRKHNEIMIQLLHTYYKFTR